MWIVFTLLAVVNQSIRTAAQKKMAHQVPASVTAWVRFAFGLPVAIIWWGILYVYYGQNISVESGFYTYATLSALAQIAATIFAVKLLTLRNFAVGTTWIKSEAMLTALVGAVFFSVHLSVWVWAAIVISVFGMMALAMPTADSSRSFWRRFVWQKSVAYGLAAGLGFALCSLWLREAVLTVNAPFMMQAATTMVVMLLIQVVVATSWLKIIKQPVSSIKAHFSLACFIGFTSALGSIGWFTAMALENAATVKALGQVEFIFTLLITWGYFKEKISKAEYIGMLIVMVAMCLLFIPVLGQ